MLRRMIIVVSVVFGLSACATYANDGHERNYRAYKAKQERAESLPNPHDRKAASSIAVGEMAGGADNVANNWEKWSPPEQGLGKVDPPDAVTETDLPFTTPYTPPLPAPGPSVKSLEIEQQPEQTAEETQPEAESTEPENPDETAD